MPVVIERFPATVTSNDDPDKRGRIKVKSLQLLGDAETEFPDFVDPVFDWGWFYVPDVGEEVEIEVIVQDDQKEETMAQAFLEGPRIRWRGKRFTSDDGEQPRPPNTQLTEKNYGKRRGFASPSGHILFFDDTPGDENVTLSWKKTDVEKFAFLSIDKDGSVIIDNQNGSLIFLNAKDGELAIIDEHGNSYSSRSTGIQIIDKFNNSIEMKDGVITVLGNKDVLVTAGSNVIVDAGSDVKTTAVQKNIMKGPAIELQDAGGIADSFAVRFTELKTAFDTHFHTAPSMGGPTTPPTVPLVAAAASTIVKLK